MIDIKRLHEVHKVYPNTSRGMGKTTYCFDALLRAAQTGKYKNLAYTTNTMVAARNSMDKFREFLYELGENYMTTSANVVTVNNCEISFIGLKDAERKGARVDGFIEDYF